MQRPAIVSRRRFPQSACRACCERMFRRQRDDAMQLRIEALQAIAGRYLSAAPK